MRAKRQKLSDFTGVFQNWTAVRHLLSLTPGFNGRKTNSFHKNIFEGRPFSYNLSEGVVQKCVDVRTGLGSPIYLFE